jgi:DNA polymerase III delta subunit
MVYIVHGDDLVKSRALILNQQKKIGCESRLEFDISEITPNELLEKSCSNDLFGNPPFIVLDITSAGRTNLDPYIKSIEKIPATTTLIILSGKTLSKSNLFIKRAQELKARTNLNELTPKSNIFNFVDAVFYRQRKKAYTELTKLLKDDVTPYEILPMLYYGLRTIASAKLDSPSYKKLHSFVKNKSSSQSRLCSKEHIISIFEKFREMDMKSKLSEIDEELLIPMAIEIVLNS